MAIRANRAKHRAIPFSMAESLRREFGVSAADVHKNKPKASTMAGLISQDLGSTHFISGATTSKNGRSKDPSFKSRSNSKAPSDIIDLDTSLDTSVDELDIISSNTRAASSGQPKPKPKSRLKDVSSVSSNPPQRQRLKPEPSMFIPKPPVKPKPVPKPTMRREPSNIVTLDKSSQEKSRPSNREAYSVPRRSPSETQSSRPKPRPTNQKLIPQAAVASAPPPPTKKSKSMKGKPAKVAMMGSRRVIQSDDDDDDEPKPDVIVIDTPQPKKHSQDEGEEEKNSREASPQRQAFPMDLDSETFIPPTPGAPVSIASDTPLRQPFPMDSPASFGGKRPSPGSDDAGPSKKRPKSRLGEQERLDSLRSYVLALLHSYNMSGCYSFSAGPP